MSDTPITPAAPVVPAPVVDPAPEVFSREYVEGIRNEAAAARIAKKDAVEAAKAEVIAEYEGKAAEKDTAFAALQVEHSATSLELLKLKTVLAAEVPTDDVLEVAALVQGTDEETVKGSVERVKSLLGKAPAKDRLVDPLQGKGNHIPLNGDPILNLLKAAVKAN